MTSFVAIVPVKSVPAAKSRLGGLPEAVRRDLARAFTLDVVAALAVTRLVEHTVVVTDDPDIRRLLAESGVEFVPDDGSLNGSLRAGARHATSERPHAQPVAVLGDLPCLVPADLDDLLASVDGAGYVPDAEGTGTTLYTAPASAFRPRFGPGSAAAHAADAIALDAPSTVRRDVDDLDSLDAARELGVGVATGQALNRHGL